MPAFHIVIKMLMLRLLLASRSGLSAYEFGYHPSAEEFDSLLRETRTWTRDLLADEQRRERFVPRYKQPAATTPWLGGTVQKVDGPGTLDFQMFSNEQEQQQQPYIYENVNYVPPQQGGMHVQSELIEIRDPPTTQKPQLHINANGVGSSISSSSASGSSSIPIFFTNPATGIVYAITEVGHGNKQTTQQNDSIPIYVTKAQYDSDLQALKQRYEAMRSSCQGATTSATTSTGTSNNKNRTTALSTPALVPPVTTARPQIIRLQKPKVTINKNVSKLPSNKLPSNKLPVSTAVHSTINQKHKPPPVMVPSGAMSISDQIKLPNSVSNKLPTTRKTKTKKTKKKKRKTRRKPGVKQSTATPAVAQPEIILGKRTAVNTPKPSPSSDIDKLATQLEKPHMPVTAATAAQETIFSEQPFVVSSGYVDLTNTNYKNHRLTRRSVATAPGASGARKISSGRPKSRSKSKAPRTPQTPQLPAQPMLPRRSGVGAGNGSLVPPAVHLLHRKHNESESMTTLSTASVLDKPVAAAIATATEEAPRKLRSKDNNKRKTQQKRDSEEPFDLLELISDEEDDDDEGEDYDDTAFYFEEPDGGGEETPKEPTKQIQKGNSEKLTDLKEDVTVDNSSSPEESADFGALEEQPISTTTLSIEDKSEESLQQSSSKNSMSIKRIKRRPPNVNLNSASDEYYDDDEEDEESGMGMSAGIGSFFRMIFYPMQLAVTRLFDGFTGQSEEEETHTKPKYPSYTQYHSAHSQGGSNELVAEDYDNEEAAEDPTSSLSSWLGSWFGLRRRTKKIGSTTIKPEPQYPPTTSEPPSWLESWFGYGKTTIPTTSLSEATSEDDDDDDGWFFGWFDTKPKPKARRRTTSTTTTTTTTPTPQVPILTIVDPLRNPQNWIGILAHHIVNATSTSTSTHNPLLQALTRSTSTTESPDIPQRISYDKYQIWRLKPQNEAQVRTLEEFKKGEDGIRLQWLKGPSLRGLTDVLVPPKMLVDFQGTLNFEGIAHEVLIFDVGKAIAYEQNKEDYLFTTPTHNKKTANKTKQGQVSTAPAITWNKYYDYEDILKYLETIRMRHAQLVELIHIGRSYEGRPLVVVKIESKQMAAAATAAAAASHKRLKYKRKSGQANAVFIEAGSQALAWIGPAAATWIVSDLLRLMRTNKTDANYDFIRNTTWYIMPVLNPDGYVYSHEYDRFWKKSRSRHVAKAPGSILDSAMTWLQQKRVSDKVCFGVDLDRNWLYDWGKRGSSKTPCNEFYAGPAPFSEPETKAVSEFLMDYRTQIKLYISLQAYGQVISYPVKTNSSFNVERMDDFLDVAMVGTDGLRKKGSKARYKVDSANDLIEHRSGCADAFAAYEIGIPFSYTLQLADNGVHGYLLPSSAIEPTARDAFEIISGMLDYI